MPGPRVEQRPHQEREFLTYRDDRARALIWYMRAGKTEPVISTVCHQVSRFALDGALVVAPHEADAIQWVRDKIPKHGWEETEPRAMFWENHRKNTKSQARDFAALLAHPGAAFMLVIPEALKTLHAQKAILAFLAAHPNCALLVDECHHFGRPGSKRTGKLRWLAPRFKLRRLMSGTPWHNSPLRAYSQYQILREGALGAATMAEFEARYAILHYEPTVGGKYNKIVKGFRHQDDLAERIARWTSFVDREQAGLPPLRLDRVRFEMTEGQRMLYERVAKERKYRHAGVELDVARGLPYISKLQQIASGFVYGPKGAPTVDLFRGYVARNPRVAALENWLYTVSGSFVILCQFRREIEGLVPHLNRRWRVVPYHGALSKGRQRENLAAFQAGRVEGIVAQAGTVTEALDLSVARTIFWYSHTVDAVDRDQGSERCSLGDLPTDVFDVAGSPVDSYVMNMTARKISVADDIRERGEAAIEEEMLSDDDLPGM